MRPAILLAMWTSLASPPAERPQVFGTIAGGLEDPRCVWVDAEHREVYVADRSANRVRTYDWDGRELGGFAAPRPVAGCATPDGSLVSESDGACLSLYDARGGASGRLEPGDLPWASSEAAAAPCYAQVARDARGRLYLCDIANRVVVVLSRTGRYARHFGRAPGETSGTELESASSFALWRDRKICILDGHAGRIYVYALDGEFLFQFGRRGGVPGEFSMPVAIAVDSRDRILVLDKNRHSIAAFDERGEYLCEYGGRGREPGWFYFPDLLVLDPEGRALVLEATLGRIQILVLPVREPDLATFERAVGEYGSGSGPSQPTSFSWDEERQEIVVADTGNGRVSAFHRDGRYLWSIDAGLTEPVAVAIAPSREIFVAEMATDEIKVFDPRGRLARTLSLAPYSRGRPVRPGRMRFDARGRLFLIDRANAQVIVLDEQGALLARFGSRGTGEAELQMPQDLFVDAEEHVWVVDSEAAVPVRVFDLSGRRLGGFGSHGDAPEGMSSPSGIWLDSRSRVFVADQFRHSVQVYDRDGRFLFRWGGAGGGRATLNGPVGIGITGDGSVLVLEKAGGRVSVWRVRVEGE